MSLWGSQKNPLYDCPCPCNRQVTQWMMLHHKKHTLLPPITPESPPPPKQHQIAHFQVDASSSRPSSGHPQLCAHSFEFNPSLPLLDPPAASNSHQLLEDVRTKVSSHFIDDVLRNLHAQTHQATNQSDDEGPEDTLKGKGDAVEDADFIDPKTDDFWNAEDIDIEDNVDLHEGIVLDWDLMAEEFIMGAEELGEFEHSLLRTLWLTGIFVLRGVFYIGP